MRPRKHPADMTFNTLALLFWNGASGVSSNWAFPIDNSGYADKFVPPSRIEIGEG